MPAELYERESNWVRLAITHSRKGETSAPSARDANEVMRRLSERVSADAISAVEHPELYAERGQILCEGTLELYEAIRGLPLGDRTSVARHLFTSKANVIGT